MKTDWTTIRVPKSLARRIRELSEEKGVAMWKILLQLTSFYSSIVKDTRRRDEIPILDKLSWYIVKLSYSISKMKDEPNEENFKWLVKTISQIKDRLNIDVTYILDIAKSYMATKSKQDLIELNMAWKQAVLDIFYYGFLRSLKESEESS